MGKRSIRENKNIYQQYREAAGLTVDKASELMETVSSSRIEKIESGKTMPHPDEVLAMSACYKAADLCNYYCSEECEIGRNSVKRVQPKDLANIVLEVVATLNTLEKDKDRLIEIAADGQIDGSEQPDFDFIKDQLEKVSASLESLNLWLAKNDQNDQ